MDLSSILSAVLAGGLAGQLTTILLGDRFTSRRDLQNWLRSERFKVFSELVDLVSSTSPKCGYEAWPGQVRSLCQQVYLLHLDGQPTKDLVEAMELVFQHTLAKRSGKITDESYDVWKEELRKDVGVLRTELAKVLHSQSQR